MLSEDEELRLASCLDSIRAHITNSELFDGVSDKTTLWLAEKLKEVNEELKLQSDNSDHCSDHCICLVCMK